MNRSLRRLAFAAALLIPSTARASTLVLDAMTDALPPNALLTLTSEPVLFIGPYCNGASCPPASTVSGGTLVWLTQSGLAGVLGGADRYTQLDEPWTTGAPSHARVRPELPGLDFRLTSNAGLWLSYGDNWNLDLVSPGATEMRFTLSGDVSPSSPLVLTASFRDWEGATQTVTLERQLVAPGLVVLDFASFLPGGFDFSGVDEVNVRFDNCNPCSGPQPDRSCSIGPITFETSTPTAARRGTWGGLKALYR